MKASTTKTNVVNHCTLSFGTHGSFSWIYTVGNDTGGICPEVSNDLMYSTPAEAPETAEYVAVAELLSRSTIEKSMSTMVPTGPFKRNKLKFEPLVALNHIEQALPLEGVTERCAGTALPIDVSE